jgi:hypothetical protein
MGTLNLDARSASSTTGGQMRPNLFQCTSCFSPVSYKASFCPNCGHVYSGGAMYVLPGKGWSWAIFGGIWLVSLVPLIISIVIFALVFGLGLIGAATLRH